ncbi:MAG: hypothetical protein HY289_13275 [Planctomycetes bacterium]|nr:hypothetical protein [Planctomycetota bacterium]
MARYTLPGTACLLVTVVLTGCSGPREVEAPTSDQNLLKISKAYREFTLQEKRPPANQQDLMKYLKEDAKVLRSENDGEEFVIFWGVDLVPGKIAPVIAHEKSGKGGVRLVLQGFSIRRMNQEEFDKAPLPKK